MIQGKFKFHGGRHLSVLASLDRSIFFIQVISLSIDVYNFVATPASWEEEFCLEVGSFLWKYILEAKQRTKNDYKLVLWNDSAAEEAFHAAKNRYFSRINGLPYADSGPLIDPDMFIGEVKWDFSDDLSTKLSLLRNKVRTKLEKDGEEEDYRYYSHLIEQIRLGQQSEV